MTDNEIIQALDNLFNHKWVIAESGGEFIRIGDVADLINRQKAEIDELTYKLECLLCHATGSKLSKSTYSLKTMESAVNDEVQECCEEAVAEAIKEFAERLKGKYRHASITSLVTLFDNINNLVKEMVGDTE